MSEPLVTVRHIRAAGLCASGARAWFARYGLDWNTFLSPGLPAPVIEATGDALALRVAAIAREEMPRGE
jgi:hypothetical protein